MSELACLSRYCLSMSPHINIALSHKENVKSNSLKSINGTSSSGGRKHISKGFDIFELQETKLPVRLINTTNEWGIVQGHESPLSVKGDIEVVSSELDNYG
ncbi:hypothetical protein TNCV_839471 [Trichonephila clavipes]|nr:hypothetical protein TNCV_839471 [Trichonephila clavipes]